MININPSRLTTRRDQVPKPADAQVHTFVSPVRGVVEDENFTVAQPGGASVLENFRVTTEGIAVRGGSDPVADCTDPVLSLMSYDTAGVKKLFAATQAKIFDISDLNVGTLTEVKTGQTGGYYVSEQFNTVGGDYLFAVNGEDNAQIFDGTMFSDATLTGVDTSLLSSTWSYRNRMFFVEKESFKAWYLPVDSISGNVTDFSLAGIFKRGGSLLTGATWSLDSGDGIDDKIVFISTNGEAAIYEGQNPSDASDWRLVGVFDLTQVMGEKSMFRAGGDVLISTVSGLIPLTEALQKDVAALSLSSASRNIEKTWLREVSQTSGSPQWEIIKWPEKNVAVVKANSDTIYVVNLENGGWSFYTGWDVNCMAYHNGRAFFGGSDGLVQEMERTGSDNGEIYTAKYSGLAEHLGAISAYKAANMARAHFISDTIIRPKLSITTNYSTEFPFAPSATIASDNDVWDAGLWDAGIWDARGVLNSRITRWFSVAGTGTTIAPQVQVTISQNVAPDIVLIAFDVNYSVGQTVV